VLKGITVLQIGKYYPPQKYGGMETVLSLLCSGLARAGAEVTALVSNRGPGTTVENIDGVKVVRAGSIGEVLSTSLCPGMPLLIKRLQADILHIHLPNPLAVLSYFLALPKGKLVVSYHSDIVRQSRVYRLYRPLLRRFLEKAERIVVATPCHIRYSPLLTQLKEKCVVVPFGIDRKWSTPSKHVLRKACQVKERYGVPLILFVGRLVYYKGLEYLIEAMKQIDGKALIIGTGPSEKKLKRTIQRAQVRDKVQLLGQVEEEDLLAHYYACDVFVLPSVEQSEAFGIVQLEAMACGKPVVSTNLRSGVPYVNRHGITGLVVEPRDPQSLADAVNLLLKDRGLRERLGEHGREQVRTRYCADRMVEEYFVLYEEVLG